jgi:DNA-binding CsgD family transcriptional regulator
LTRKHDDDVLQRLIARTLSVVAGASGAHAGVMRAARPSGKRPYGILVTPVPTAHHALAALHPAVCIVISDPALAVAAPAQLRAAFDLTEAEARLAALLANGEELRAAAEQLHITYGTARARLSEIFQKTDTRRQGELVTVLLRTLAPL